jgi:hypothetical protein
MKDQIQSAAHTIIRDRQLATLLGVFVFLCIGLLIFIGVSIHPSELQVVVHYTSYGTTNFYRDKWYYLVAFGVFVVMMAIAHTILSYKLLQSKGRSFAIAFIWLGFILLAVSATLFYQVLKIASLS